MAEGVKRKISAIMSADVVGYSKLMEADEETTVRTMESYRDAISSIVQQHNGRVVDSPGDNLLSEFGSVVDAVQCAVEVQHVIRAKNAVAPEARRMQFRIGISLEDVIEEGDRIYGDGVNIASRIEGMADPGGICISGAAYEQIKRKLALGYEDLGEHSVKNISWPVQVYRIPLDSGAATDTRKDTAAILPEKPSIAVLPFDNLSSDPEQEYFADGMVDEIIARLSVNSMLSVVSRNSTFFYKDKQIKLKQVGEELGARYIVDGSVRKAGNKVRITAQLIDAVADKHLWSQTYERELSDIFALQDEIAQQIVSALDIEYTEAEMSRVKRIPTESLTAYDSVLQGMNHLYLRTKEGSAKAREMFERAIELDPQYAMAYMGLGGTYIFDYLFGGGGERAHKQASKFVRKAISLDDSVYHGHADLGNLYRFQGRYELALAEVQRALSLNPNDAWAYVIICSVNNELGNPDKALEAITKAMRLNPHYDEGYLTELAWAYNNAGQYEKAIASLNEAIVRNPDYPMIYWALAVSYVGLGRHEDAISTCQDGLSRDPDVALIYNVLGIAYSNAGRFEEVIAAYQNAISRNPDHHLFHTNLANTYVQQWITQQNKDPKILDRAMEIAQKSITLDAGSIQSHYSLAIVYEWEKQHEKSIAEAEKMIAINPNSASGYAHLANMYNLVGRYEEAIEIAEKARKINASTIVPFRRAFRLSGRYEDAVSIAEQSVVTPNLGFFGSYWIRVESAILYAELDRIDEAKAEAAEVLKLVPNFSVDVWGERVPYKDPAMAERDMAALRKAGLK